MISSLTPFPALMRTRYLVALILAAGVAATAFTRGQSSGASNATTLIFVRHAEKADTSRDTQISLAGEERAMALSDVLGDAGIAAIYATPFRRTQQTVKQLSQRVGVPVTVFDATSAGGADYGKTYLNEVLSKHRGETVVIAGHSNTLPAMMRAAGVDDVRPVADFEYDNLYVVTIPQDGKARIIRARFGAASAH